MNKIFRLLRYDWPLHLVLLLTNWLPDNIFFIRFRGSLAKPFFKKCGKNLGLGRNVTFYNSSQIEIGDSVYIAFGCWILGAGKVLIEDEVMFGPYVVISPGNHLKKNGSFRFGPSDFEDMTIGKGAWIGSHCSLVMGAKVGNGTLIASNSVLNKVTENDSLYGGVPAKFIKKI
jgi:acetyltransferase-like isoleucine patch superfamily enzyme